MKETICAICQTNAHTQILYPPTFNQKLLNSKTFSARRIPDRMHYQFLFCKKCSLIFSSPILPQKTIKKLYHSSNFTYDTEATYLAVTYGLYLEKLLPKKGREKLRLLDIGCGNGFFLEKAKDLGVQHVYGIEPGKASIAKARLDIKKNIKEDILRSGLYPKNSFDIICCFHTFDHIVDPNAFLKTVYTYLKKNGKILFVTHNTNGLSVKVFGEKSPIFDIEHIYLFNENTLAQIFRQNGFKHTEVSILKNTYPLHYWFHLTPFPKKYKTLMLTKFKHTFFGRLPLTISAGNIAITASKI